jgi:hypothetical protein
MITLDTQRAQTQVMVNQALLPAQDEHDQFNQTNLVIGYLLDNFPPPELTTENVRLTHYVLSKDPTEYDTDNYADLPDVIYPIAVMRYLATRLNEQLRFRGQEYPHMAAYIDRYHIINVCIRRYNLRTIKTSLEIKEDEHIRDARKRGLSAVEWLQEWTHIEAEILAAKSTSETSQSHTKNEIL